MKIDSKAYCHTCWITDSTSTEFSHTYVGMLMDEQEKSGSLLKVSIDFPGLASVGYAMQLDDGSVLVAVESKGGRSELYEVKDAVYHNGTYTIDDSSGRSLLIPARLPLPKDRVKKIYYCH